MRRFLILFITLAIGAGALWYFEYGRRTANAEDDSSPGVGASVEIAFPAPGKVAAGVGDSGSAPGEAEPKESPTDGGTADQDLEAGDAEKSLIGDGGFAAQSGEMSVERSPRKPGDPRMKIRWEPETILDAADEEHRLKGIHAETFELGRGPSASEVLRSRIRAEKAIVRGKLSELSLPGTEDEFNAELQTVVIRQMRGTPLAPLTIEAPRMDVEFYTEALKSIGDDIVTFRSRDVRGWGRGLQATTSDSALDFLKGANITFELGGGRIATISTHETGSLSIVEESPAGIATSLAPRVVRVRANSGVKAELRQSTVPGGTDGERSGGDVPPGANQANAGEGSMARPVVLDADDLDILIQFTKGGNRPRILSARAQGAVQIQRGTDVYRGDSALFTFNGAGDLSVCVLKDDPSLAYRIKDKTGEELEVEISGAGPLTATFIDSTTPTEDGTASREIGMVFLGPGRIEAVDRGDAVTFEERVYSKGLDDRSDLEVVVEGDVRVRSSRGDLRSDVLEAIFGSKTELHVRADGPTRVTHRDLSKVESYRLRAAGGMDARLTDAGWFVERAEEVVAESIGSEPYRVEAGLIENVDLQENTLEASTNVLYRTSWGSAFAPTAITRGKSSVVLFGSEEDPVRLDLVPEDKALEVDAAEIAGVRSGWLHAPTLTMDETSVLAEGGVAAQFETLDAVWGIDGESVLLRRVITGRALSEEDGPVPVGLVQASRAEEIHVEASFVREARFDGFNGSGIFRATRLELDAAMRGPNQADAPEDQDRRAILDQGRDMRLHLLGDVSMNLMAFSLEEGQLPVDVPPAERQSWRLQAAEATLVRHAFQPAAIEASSPTAGDPELKAELRAARSPFTLTAEDVEDCHFEGGGQLVDVASDHVTINGFLGVPTVNEDGKKVMDLTDSSLVARGTVRLRVIAGPGQPEMQGKGETFSLYDGERGRLVAPIGKRVLLTGVLPGEPLPYTMEAAVVDFTRTTIEASTVFLRLQTAVRVSSMGGVALRELRAERMSASADLIYLKGRPERPVVCLIENEIGGLTKVDTLELSLDPATLKQDQEASTKADSDQEPQRTLGPFAPVPAWRNEFAGQEDEGPEKADPEDGAQETPQTMQFGETTVSLSNGGVLQFKAGVPDGTKLRLIEPRITLPDMGIAFRAQWISVDPRIVFGAGEDFLFDSSRGVLEGGEGAKAWTVEFAGIETKPLQDEALMTIVAPIITVGGDEARADFLAVWIDKAAWQKKGKGVLQRTPADEGSTEVEAPVIEKRPNFLAEMLFEMQSEDYAKYLRALFMEGGVEISRADKRAARGSRLYINLHKASAWLEDAELVYPLMNRGEEVPLRVRTERLATDEEGALVADGATLTTCDHDVPHFVVRTGRFALEPRPDGRWRFSANGNVLRFQTGFKLPLPSISNLVLDENFGVEGFENEAGEVTPFRDIGIGQTARFGTVLGAAFRFDVGKFGSWIGERLGMNTDRLTGRWDTEAQYLGSRGPLVGLGLFLRERELRDELDEDFRLDAFISGIPDGGEDRGTVRVDEMDRDELRLFGYARSRYPIVRGEWLDVAFASQTDAGVQAEFREGEFMRFEQRDTFVRWRKSFGADYLTAGGQKRVNDFRSQKEELPSFLAYRGERSVGRLAGAPLLWGGTFEAGYFTRRPGDPDNDLFSDLPVGAGAPVGNEETGRADIRQRLSMPLTTQLAGVKIAPFVDARATAWTSALGEGDDPARAAIKSGVELSTTLHKVADNGYLHALAPRLSASVDTVYNESGGSLIPLDQTEDAIDGTMFEAGLRAIWLRPNTFENFDLDVRGILRTNRENGLADTTEIGTLAEYITRYGRGIGQVGFRLDSRFDLEASETTYSRSSIAWKPNGVFLVEARYGQARDVFGEELFETGSILSRWRVDDKWEIETTYVQDLQTDKQLFAEFVLRRFSHDFVLDISFLDRAGEGGSTIAFRLLPILGWTRDQLGMLDRRQ